MDDGCLFLSKLKEIVYLLPELPGVYQYFNSDGKLSIKKVIGRFPWHGIRYKKGWPGRPP